MLVEKEVYVQHGVHIGTSTKNEQMKKFIYRILPNGLALFKIELIDQRIRIAANFLSKFNEILVASKKARKPVELFCSVVGAKPVIGRFPPGMLTNPNYELYYEPEVVLVVDPFVDKQAVSEASKARLPIVALCNTFNSLSLVDLAIPCNNRGRKSVALVFYLLAREIEKIRGKIRTYADFKYKVEDFLDV